MSVIERMKLKKGKNNIQAEKNRHAAWNTSGQEMPVFRNNTHSYKSQRPSRKSERKYFLNKTKMWNEQRFYKNLFSGLFVWFFLKKKSFIENIWRKQKKRN